jgi:prepilin-type N-terminal cleavage/methylation domain-containing protein
MKNFKENRGFTLIEIIVVIAIIGIGIVPMLNYFTNSISHIHETETRSQAVTIAGDVIELIKQEIRSHETSSDWNNYLDEFDNSTVNDSKEVTLLSNISNEYDFLSNFNLDVQVKPFTFIESFSVSENKEIGREIEVVINWDSGGKTESVSTLIKNRAGD